MGFMFCDLHVSLKEPFVGGYKLVEFVLFHYKKSVKRVQEKISKGRFHGNAQLTSRIRGVEIIKYYTCPGTSKLQ